jgi:hypothetical protein
MRRGSPGDWYRFDRGAPDTLCGSQFAFGRNLYDGEYLVRPPSRSVQWVRERDSDFPCLNDTPRAEFRSEGAASIIKIAFVTAHPVSV